MVHQDQPRWVEYLYERQGKSISIRARYEMECLDKEDVIIRLTDRELSAVGDGIEAAARGVGLVVVVETAGGRIVQSEVRHGSRAAKKHHRGNNGNLHSEI